MEFGLLGPLSVRCGGAPVPLPVGKRRAVLAALLLDAGQVVRLDELAEVLWADGPPPSARVALQNHVMRLRRALGVAGQARITTHPGGYRIGVEAGELDVSQFEALLAQAQTAGEDGGWNDAAGRARAALALWRGEPLADAGSELLALREAPRLAEMRLQALELRIEADLRLGGHARVIGELRKLTGTHPLRERLHGLLMLALYRDGRQGEALDVYRRVRSVLVESLGTEPGPGLRLLQRQILTADPALTSPPSGAWRTAASLRQAVDGPAADDSSGPVAPRLLPGTVRHFTGRSAELATLTRLLNRAGEPAAMVISAIGGTAGVGKTALAVHWANQVTGRFPDGQLYVNLRGYDPGRPVAAGDALARFLRALGVPGPDIPAEPAEQAARYQSLLAGRRILVLLDNAGSVAQVRPLLPASPSCVTVVTSRDALTGLVARDGAVRLDLDLLPAADAARLLRALIGARAKADPVATAALAGRCARLPLALRVAAELAAARPEVPLTRLVAELADRQGRLDLLDAGGDPQTAVRTVFSWSCRYLPAEAARMFRLAGLHPGPDLDAYAAAALAGRAVEQASQSLDVLARAHLIQPAGPGRHSLHDLLRDYACELAAAQDGRDERRSALTRLFDHYLGTAAAAMDTLYPAERHRRPVVAPPTSAVPPVTEPADARAWLDAQRPSLIAAAVHAAGHGWPGHATRLSAVLFRYLDAGGHYTQARALHTRARSAARRAGDQPAEAVALTSIGVVDWRQGRYQQATRHHQQALTLYRETGDLAGEAGSQGNLGLVEFRQGRYDQATSHYRQALALYRQLGNRNGEARALSNLGDVHWRQGRYAEAGEHYRQALARHRETGHQPGEADALTGLGDVSRQQGDYAQAAQYHQQALALCRETGNREGTARALAGLGDAHRHPGGYEQSVGQYEQALALYRETGNRFGETEALNGLGEALLAAGQASGARASYAAALALASQTGDRYQQARAHHGLGGCHAASDPGQARRHWRRALALYTSLGAPEASQITAKLDASAPGS